MKILKRLDLLLVIACIFFCVLTKVDASPTRYSEINKRDDPVVDYHHTTLTRTSTSHPTSTSTSKPGSTSSAQNQNPEIITLYSSDWWVIVYGSLNGIRPQMAALGALLIVIGLFLCTMGFRLWRPMLGVMGLLTFGMVGWVALANCRPVNGYVNDTIIMIVVPVAIGIVGAILYFVFWNIAFYLAGALGGFAFALFICSWKYNLVIVNLIGRSSFLGGMALVFAIATFFLLRHLIFFTTSFVGAYITMLGIDCLARKGYIAGFEAILNRNPHSQIEYTVSTYVYVLLAMTLVLFLISLGWQHLFNAAHQLGLKMVAAVKGESEHKEESHPPPPSSPPPE